MASDQQHDLFASEEPEKPAPGTQEAVRRIAHIYVCGHQTITFDQFNEIMPEYSGSTARVSDRIFKDVPEGAVFH